MTTDQQLLDLFGKTPPAWISVFIDGRYRLGKLKGYTKEMFSEDLSWRVEFDMPGASFKAEINFVPIGFEYGYFPANELTVI